MSRVGSFQGGCLRRATGEGGGKPPVVTSVEGVGVMSGMCFTLREMYEQVKAFERNYSR